MQQIDNAQIVLLHGWGMNKEVWKGLLSSMPATLSERVHCLDLPGYGHNKTVPKPYSISAISGWLENEIAQILTTTGAAKCHLIGWSIGGLICLDYVARNNANNVLSVGLIASTTKFQASDEQAWPGIKPDVLANFAKQLQANHQLIIQRFLAIQTMGSETAKQDVKQIKSWLLEAPEPNPEALAGGLTLLQTVDLNTEVNNIEIPVYGLFGKLDSLVPIAVLDELQNSIKDFHPTVIKKASHAPFISHPQQTLDWLNAHF